MKRTALIRHITRHGCYLDQEGGRHSIYRNPQDGSGGAHRVAEFVRILAETCNHAPTSHEFGYGPMNNPG